MTKLEQLTCAAASLSDEELEELLAHVRYLSSGTLLDTAPAEVQASIERGIEEHESGRALPAADVFARLQDKIDSARK